MTIVSSPAYIFSPREEPCSDLGILISEAASSEDAVDPWSLSADIVDAFDARVLEVWDTVETSAAVQNALRDLLGPTDMDYGELRAAGILMVRTVRKAMATAWSPFDQSRRF